MDWTPRLTGVEKNFDKMFGFAKWTIAIVAILILIEVILPMIRRWMGISVIGIALAWMSTTAQAQLYIDIYPS